MAVMRLLQPDTDVIDIDHADEGTKQKPFATIICHVEILSDLYDPAQCLKVICNACHTRC